MPVGTQEPNLGLYTDYTTGQSGWTNEYNANQNKIGAMVQLSVKDRTHTAPPGSPANGDRYLVAASATGVWAGQDAKIAVYRSALSAWEFYAPLNGWDATIEAENIKLSYMSGAWGTFIYPGLGTMASQSAASVAITGGSITGITDLAVADGGTGASTASGARTNLGLGTIATQDASAVAITGGTINGTTLGATTPSTAKVTSLDASLDVNLSGSGKKIQGDLSNATLTNRVMVQSNVTNGNSNLEVIPNGTSVTATVGVINNATPTNSCEMRISVNSTESVLESVANGSGTVLPVAIKVGGTAAINVSTAQNVGLGVASPNTDCKLQVSNGIKLGNAANSVTTVLDWYEEGTFTPVAIGTTSAGSATYSVQAGKYQRVGNTVNFEFTISYTSHSGSGSLKVTGLPFTTRSDIYTAYALYCDGIAFTSGNRLQTYTLVSDTAVYFDQATAAGSVAAITIPATMGKLIVNGSYEV